MAGTFDLVFVVNSHPDTKRWVILSRQPRPARQIERRTIAAGGTQNLGGELFKSVADLNVQIVP